MIPTGAGLLRWSIVLLGLGATWLTPFQEYLLHRVFISFALIGLGVLRDHVAAEKNRDRDSRIATITGEAAAASADAAAAKLAAEDAKRGRRLSPDQMAAISVALKDQQLSAVRVTVTCVPTSDAQDLAHSLSELLV